MTQRRGKTFSNWYIHKIKSTYSCDTTVEH